MTRLVSAWIWSGLTFAALVPMGQVPGAPPLPPLERRNPARLPAGNPAKPSPPGKSPGLPDSIRTAKDPGARESWKPDGPDDPFLYAYGDTATYRDTPDGGIANLVGNARLLYRATSFASATVVYNRRTQIGTAPGKLQVDDEQNTITGDRGEADYGKKVARINGHVVVTARPKPDSGASEGSARKDFRNPVRIEASEVVYNWKTKIADTSKDTVIRFTVRKRNWEVTADKIQYRGNEETAYLDGNVRAVNDQGDEMRSNKAVVVLRDGEESMVLEPSQRGSKFRIEDDEKEDGPGKGTEKPGRDPGKPDAGGGAGATPPGRRDPTRRPGDPVPPVRPPAKDPGGAAPPVQPGNGVERPTRSSDGNPGAPPVPNR
jgi:lipopolysaccharide export system protein LptA